jgi:predicted cupin superfamily sugar epimerase
MSSEADAIIAGLNLKPHPEGGHYAETFRDPDPVGGRSHSTAIYFLLKRGERSHWHRIDAAEAWHFHGGAPLRLSISADGVTSEDRVLGLDLAAGARPQIVVPRGQWFAAESLGDYTWVSCTVAPGFDFAGFELAPPGWVPGHD